MRESGRLDAARLAAVREAAAAWPDDWLLRAEVDELLGAPGLEARA
jgi:phenylalanine-4-hydroxylase